MQLISIQNQSRFANQPHSCCALLDASLIVLSHVDALN